jgi:large repetitive protein
VNGNPCFQETEQLPLECPATVFRLCQTALKMFNNLRMTMLRLFQAAGVFAVSIALTLAPMGSAHGAGADELTGLGVVYENDRVPGVPWSIHTVKIDRSRPELELIASKAGGRVIGLGTLSAQVEALPPEAGRPLAAINGDFYQTEQSPYRGDPRGLMIVRGEVLSSPSANPCFWIDAGGKPHIEKVESRFKVTWPDGKATPFALNEAREADAAVLYTPSLGRSTLTRHGREIVLENGGTGAWLPLEVGRVYQARVRSVADTNNTVIPKDALVLSLGPQLLGDVPAVKAGDIIKISTSTTPDLIGVKTAIGGGPKLAENGKATPPVKPADLTGNVPYSVRALFDRHPRSAIGFNKTHFFLVEVDGRQPGLSLGMSLAELADYLVKLGCTEAMNLDGGASAQLIVNGRVVNSPSAGRERATATGIALLQKKSK